MQRPPLDHAWTLTDGHAGNVRQAHALAAALGLPTHDWSLAARAPWRWLAPRRLPGAASAFGGDFARQRADVAAGSSLLAIGCGRQGALATRLLRERGAHAVQILDPRIDARHWDVVIVPAHDRLRGANVISLLGSLHPVDDAWLEAGRSAFTTLAALPRPRTALLLGGASAHSRFDATALAALVRDVAAWAAHDGGSVLATASRRTPPAARESLPGCLAGVPHVAWRDGRDGPNPYAGVLGWADRIVCTADSVNMLSEAAATRVSLAVAGIDALDGRPRAFVDALLASGRVQRFDAHSPLASGDAAPLREGERVARLVRERLPFAGA